MSFVKLYAHTLKWGKKKGEGRADNTFTWHAGLDTDGTEGTKKWRREKQLPDVSSLCLMYL